MEQNTAARDVAGRRPFDVPDVDLAGVVRKSACGMSEAPFELGVRRADRRRHAYRCSYGP